MRKLYVAATEASRSAFECEMASMMHLYSARLREEKPLFAANCFSLFLSLSMQPCSEDFTGKTAENDSCVHSGSFQF